MAGLTVFNECVNTCKCSVLCGTLLQNVSGYSTERQSDWRIMNGEDVEGSGGSKIEILCQNFLEGTEENQRRNQDAVFSQILEPGLSWM